MPDSRRPWTLQLHEPIDSLLQINQLDLGLLLVGWEESLWVFGAFTWAAEAQLCPTRFWFFSSATRADGQLGTTLHQPPAPTGSSVCSLSWGTFFKHLLATGRAPGCPGLGPVLPKLRVR